MVLTMKFWRFFIITGFAMGSLFGCDRLAEGIEAYHHGEFEKAVKLLKPVVRKYEKQVPVIIRVNESEAEDLPSVLPGKTVEMYMAWEAYAGSLLGLNRVLDSCLAGQTALRALKIDNTSIDGEEELWVDPREGDFWQSEVRTLRSFWITMDCDTVIETGDDFPYRRLVP